MKYLDATARIVGPHRYTLQRRWSGLGIVEPRIVWVMLNPSTADGADDDPTVRKVVGFSKRWGYGSALIVNLSAYRATDPRELGRDHVGPGIENAETVWRALLGSPVVAAWGDGIRHLRTSAALALVLHMARRGSVDCLGRTRAGNPRHPARIAYETPLERWTP